MPNKVLHGLVKWRANAKVHAFNAKTGLILCGEPNDGVLYPVDKPVTCRICLSRIE